MVGAGAMFMVFLNLDKFQKFKGAGFEAELKETVEKAYATNKEFEGLINELKSMRFELAIDEEYIKGVYGFLDNEIMTQLNETKSSYTTSELSDVLNVDRFLIDYRLNELIIRGRVEKITEPPNTIKYRMILGQSTTPDPKPTL